MYRFLLLADENQVAGTLIGALSSTDVDAGDSHTYTLVSGAGSTHNSSFAISNGQVQTAVALDYEITPVMNIRVRTTDAGGLTYEKSLTITVNDNNDAPTDLSLSSATFAENLSAGTTIAALSGADQDAVDTHTYTLVSGAGDTDNASFTVAGTQLQTLNSFDFESQSPLSIRLRITDSQGADYEEAVVLNVTNVNEVPLTLMLSADSIAENEAAGTLVSNLSATDTDNNDSHTYQLVTGTGDADNSSFSISGNTLLSAASFDFEIKNSYSIRLRATDAGGLFTDSAMIIRITDINESTTAIGEVNKPEGIIISPNPATHILEINAPV
ncbi:MAG: cadherin repeat domain-containing protein [Bacteroidetes bacterium]|nr:cadherin repeat domain-containing protein [Bacteroidota bacterium]